MVEMVINGQQENWQKADARVLGQILAAQNILVALPDTTRIAEFYAQTLISIPGIAACRVCLGDQSVQAGEMDSSVCEECDTLRHVKAEGGTVLSRTPNLRCHLAEHPDMRSVSIDSYENHFGSFTFKIGDDNLFNIYHPFIKNLSGHIAITLENRLQKGLLQKAHDELELRVKERTHDLTVANERFSLAARAANLGVWDWDIQKDELVWDDGMYALYGIQREDFAGAYEAWLKGVHPDDRPASHEVSKLAQRGDRDYDTEFRVVWPDGSIHYLKAYGQIVRDTGGTPLRMTGINFDVTEPKLAEERLRLLDFALDHVSEAAFLTDENARFQFVNEESCRILGYTRTELLGLGVSDIDPDFPMDRWLSHWNDLKTQGSIILEGRHKTKDGRIIPVEINANYFEYGGQSYNLALVRDITERKQAEQERQANLRFLESMDRVNRAIQGANDLEQMMSVVLNIVLSIFDCDRAWLFYPCDPDAPTFRVPMEVTRTEYPGAGVLNVDVPMPPDMAQNLRETLESVGPVTYTARTDRPINKVSADQFGVKSMMMVALYPKSGKPWAFGLHQCSHPRVWTSEEERLFQEIGRRLADALTSLSMQRNLQDSEIRYREIFENTSDVITVSEVTEDGRIRRLDCNTAWEDAYGIDRTSVIGRFHEVLPAGSEPDRKVLEQHQTCLRNGAPIDFDHEWQCGSEVWYFHSTLIPVRNAAGSIYRLIGVGHNITEHKRAEEAADRANQEWERTFNAISDLIMVLDAQHKILRANKATANALGMTQQDLIGKFCFELFHGEKEPPGFCPHSQLLTDGEVHSAELVEPRLGAILDIRVSPILDHNKTVIGSVHVTRDITERKRAEAALRESEQRFRIIFDRAPLGIALLGLDYRLLKANKAYCDLLGYSEEELCQLRLGDFTHPDDLEENLRLQGELGSGKVLSFQMEKRFIRKDGETAVGLLVASSLSDDAGLPQYFLGLVLDITDRKKSEDDIRRSEERLELALRGADLGLWDWYVQTGDTTANQRAAEMAGYSLDEIDLSFDFWESLVHPDDRPRALEKVFNHLRGLTDHYEDEYRVRHKSGVWKWILARGKIAERDLDGKPLRVTGTFLDVTAKKLSESQASEANELREKIFSESPMGIAVLRADGQCISANEALGKIVGADEEGILTRSFPNLASWKDSGLLADAEQILAGGIHNQREVNLTTTFGKSVWVNARMARITYGDEPHLLIVLNDITARRTAQDTLKFEREQLLSLFESLNEVILVIDPQTYGILYANKFIEDLYGKQLIGGVCYEELHGLDVPCEHCHNKIIVELQGKPYQWEYSNPTLKRDFLATDRLIRWPDGRDVKFQLAIDITERNTAEQEQEHLRVQLFQAQKMESIGTLAGGIAHDFNNLLQVIIGYSDMMLFHKKATDPEYEGLCAIRQAGRDGGELAKRILAFSRRLEPDARPVNLNNEIRRVQKMLERTLPKMIRVEILLADNLMTVNADPGQLEQVLLNLAVNAQHAMPDGGRLTIETANVTLDEDYSRTHLNVEPGEYVLLTVSDTGHGMDKEVMEHIFEPFYTTKGPDEGTGLGLAMVFGIVKIHKGHITCYSEPGTGTAFKICLPAIVQKIEQDGAVTRQMPAFGTETILLVDDEKFIRRFGEEMLKMAGYTVLMATNGREALEIYRPNQDRIALVLLDLVMPEMGGKQCLAELLKINPRVKVVIASGYSANGPTKDALSVGAKGFVNKPYDIRQVLEVVRTVLDAK